MSEMRAAGYEPKMSMSSEGKMSATFEKKSYTDVAKEAKAVSDIAGIQRERQFQQGAQDVMEGFPGQEQAATDITQLLPQIPTGGVQRPLQKRVPPRLRERVGQAQRLGRAQQLKAGLGTTRQALVQTGKGWERQDIKGEPGWAQQQKVAAVKTGLQRGEVVYGEKWGDLKTFPVTTLKEAHQAIEYFKLDPRLFESELRVYRAMGNAKIEEKRTTPQGRPIAKLTDKRVIYLDTGEEVK